MKEAFTLLVQITYLVEEQLTSLLFAQVHLFDSDQFPTAFDSSYADDAGGSFANFNVVVQEVARVSRVHHHLQRRTELLVRHSLGLTLRGTGLLGGCSRGRVLRRRGQGLLAVGMVGAQGWV